MKQELKLSKKAILKLLMLSVIVIFSFKNTDAQTSSKWISFSIEIQNKNIVNLCWSVDQQKDNKEYIIQRSSDMKIWKAIGEIKSKSGENIAEYSFNDKNLYDGMNYYRIQQKDIYGNTSYSVLKVFDYSAKSIASELAYSQNKTK